MELTFTPVTSGGETIGHEWRTEQHHCFFANTKVEKAQLPLLFPNYEFCHLKQVHGDGLLEANPSITPDADAHWSKTPLQALTIQTADCLPVLFWANGFVCAAHAGWRGIANQLLVKCAAHLRADGAPHVSVAIGPHIQGTEFEVGLDVAQKIENSTRARLSRGDLYPRPHNDPEKRYVNLASVAAAQIRSELGANTQIYFAPQSTLSDFNYSSFRRSQGAPGRQYSFVVLLQ